VEKKVMKSIVGAFVLCSMVWACSAAAQTSNAPPPVKCRVAEINPVTNQAYCIDPVGAALDPPPAAQPCHVTASSDSWTMSNRRDTTPDTPSK
jgi:hypothetical protein